MSGPIDKCVKFKTIESKQGSKKSTITTSLNDLILCENEKGFFIAFKSNDIEYNVDEKTFRALEAQKGGVDLR